MLRIWRTNNSARSRSSDFARLQRERSTAKTRAARYGEPALSTLSTGATTLQATRLPLQGSSTVTERRYSRLAIAALAAIACLTAIHWAILAGRLARGLIRRKADCANHGRQNRKQNFSVLFHTGFNLLTSSKLREGKDRPPESLQISRSRHTAATASIRCCRKQSRVLV
jgi:hypothetical protein